MRLLRVGLLGLVGVPAQGLADPFEKLESHRWVRKRNQIETCEQGEIWTANPDRSALRVETGSPMRVRGETRSFASYTVLGHGADYIDMSLDQETYRDKWGALVWWRLQFLSNGTYVWYRSDWMGGHTPPHHPCRILS